MDGLAGIIERDIQDGMERGLFDNLPGKGSPIDLRPENPFEGRLASVLQRMLRDNGASHPAIEAVRALDQESEEMRAGLHKARYRFAHSGELAQWEAACHRFRKAAKDFNRRLILHNLKTPVASFQRLRLDAEAEIRHAEKRP